MKRREFITLLAGTAAACTWPLLAHAQQSERVRRVGILSAPADDAEGHHRVGTFQQELRKLGWIEGRNVRIELRWGGDDVERLRAHAAELVGMAPDAIYAVATPAVLALRQATRTVPIVFTNVGDPAGSGLIDSLARPGGNITGFSSFEHAIGGKWMELLKEIAPAVARVLVMLNPENPTSRVALRTIEALAPSFGMQIIAAEVHDASEIERAFAAFARGSNGALIVMPDAVTVNHRERIAALAVVHRIPAIYPFRFFVAAGGLMSYGTDPTDSYRRAAGYVDRILKGDKPDTLPVQLPTRFELVVNLKAAKAIGLTISETFLVRADEVIE
jgi:putative ABC transport system substrate-binding protein